MFAYVKIIFIRKIISQELILWRLSNSEIQNKYGQISIITRVKYFYLRLFSSYINSLINKCENGESVISVNIQVTITHTHFLVT